ncbi:hypothetical protein HanRHA438_Chr16g0750521 [Helianthus annuus]|nr:hypothetical protein HanIR_Chr16g0802551 [Helianthus annuus]KAJ0644177.1 hypothetical protein HanOQP8_Chr16g0609031 [Helianthus annuus]KAJ0820427.1 hypothetical protein HanPSC8_Chr16g0707871 [Helianthus annuus]KAJ0835036.1 hypothetical protein HanRHA438_Chr16g0750521 [Helianthus annuus]
MRNTKHLCADKRWTSHNGLSVVNGDDTVRSARYSLTTSSSLSPSPTGLERMMMWRLMSISVLRQCSRPWLSVTKRLENLGCLIKRELEMTVRRASSVIDCSRPNTLFMIW